MKEIKNTIFEFEYPSFEKHRRGTMWYIIAMLITGALIVYAVVTSNFLFAVLIVLIAFIIFVHDMRG